MDFLHECSAVCVILYSNIAKKFSGLDIVILIVLTEYYLNYVILDENFDYYFSLRGTL